MGYNDVWNTIDGRRWTQVRPNTLTATGVWEGRHCGGYVVFKEKMWIVGGDPLLKHYQNDVWSSEDGAVWQQVTANAPWGQRNLHVTMVHDGKIWVMGGQTVPQFVPDVPEAFYNDVWNSADGVKWTRVTSHAACPVLPPVRVARESSSWIASCSIVSTCGSSPRGIRLSSLIAS